jgi:hypothetical protein
MLGAAGTRHIRANNLDGRVKRIDEGLEDFEVDPDPVHQQQRCADAVA